LGAALDAGDVACFLLALDDADDGMWRRACDRLIGPIQERGVAFLLREHAHLVDATGADGIHTDESIADLPETLAHGMIRGAGCGLSRHDAMIAGELGADYVAFGPWCNEAADHLSWWQALMEPPCIAWGCENPDDAAEAARAGADFVALGGRSWPDSETIAEAAAAIAKLPGR